MSDSFLPSADALPLGRAASGQVTSIIPCMANRHGLIAGATGTGKTVTLQVLAEQFSRIGVPVFMADVKGDLSGIAAPGVRSQRLDARLTSLGNSTWVEEASPVAFWDVFQKSGIPLRTTVSEIGPVLFGRFLDLSPAQQDVLEVAFKLADDQGLLLLDLKDLSALLAWISEHSDDLRADYGNAAPATLASIQRSIITLGAAGGSLLFGEPALRLEDLMHVDFSGRGVVSILDATKLLLDSRAYATALLWLLSELFERLDEVGDVTKPRFVFFFDEAHLLFKDAPTALVERIELVVRLIRSKGVGVYFVTQNPLDIPGAIIGQLGNRIQHALRAYTPAEQKAVRVAAQSFRPNPTFSTEEAISQLGVGEALVSVLDTNGVPTPVERVMVSAPRSKIGALEIMQRSELVARSPLMTVYGKTIDRDSAFERLRTPQNSDHPLSPAAGPDTRPGLLEGLFGSSSAQHSTNETTDKTHKPPTRTTQRQGYLESFAKSMLRSVGSSLGREILRGALGSMKR